MPAPKRPPTTPQNWEPEENAVLLYFRNRRFPCAVIRDILNLRFGRESRIIDVETKLAEITDMEVNAGRRPFYDKTTKIKEYDLKLVDECISRQMDPAFLWTKVDLDDEILELLVKHDVDLTTINKDDLSFKA